MASSLLGSLEAPGLCVPSCLCKQSLAQAKAHPAMSHGRPCSQGTLAACPGQRHPAVGRRPPSPWLPLGTLAGLLPGPQNLNHYLTLLPRALPCPEGLQVPLPAQQRSGMLWGTHSPQVGEPTSPQAHSLSALADPPPFRKRGGASRWASGKEPTCQCERRVRSLGLEDPLAKRVATQSSLLAWEIPRTEEPGGLQSMGSQRVGLD